MKGPHARSRHPIRRTWECPHCHKRVLTPGRVAQYYCHICTRDPDAPVWMKVVDEPRYRPFPYGLANN